jgi:hypothetical protein
LAVTTLLLVLGAGVALGRATAPPPTAPVEQVKEERPAVAAAWPGPTRVEAGVPVGYTRSREGAIAAAAQYAAAFDGRPGLVEEDREAVLAVIAAADAREQIAASIEPGSRIVVDNLGLTSDVIDAPGFVGRTVPAGHQVESYDDAEATVRIWSTSLFFAEGRLATANEWATQTLRLRWGADDWKLVGFSTAPGPTPPTTPTPQRPGLGEAINAFDRFSHVPRS